MLAQALLFKEELAHLKLAHFNDNAKTAERDTAQTNEVITSCWTQLLTNIVTFQFLQAM